VKINYPARSAPRPLKVLSRARRLPACLNTSKLASNKRPLKDNVEHAASNAAAARAVGAHTSSRKTSTRVVASPQGHGDDVTKNYPKRSFW